MDRSLQTMSNVCPKCNEVVNKRKKSHYRCDACSGVFHESCSSYSLATLKELQECNGIITCKGCTQGCKQVLANIKLVSDCLDSIEGLLDEMTKKIEGMEKQNVGTTTTSPMQYKEQDQSAIAACEIIEQKKRANNMIIKGLPEQGEEDERGCMSEVKVIFESIGCQGEIINVSSCFRLGKKRETNSSRPILVAMMNIESKEIVMKRKMNLKSSEQHSKVRISDDLTPGQRQHLSNLFKEAEAKNLEADATGHRIIVCGRRNNPWLKKIPINVKTIVTSSQLVLGT